jgi:hypothetical protein
VIRGLRRCALLVALAIGAAGAPGSVAHAQYVRYGDATHAAFLIGGGVTFPAGGIAGRVDETGGFMLGLEVREGQSPIALRFDGSYAQFDGPHGWASVDAISFSAVFLGKQKSKFQPYGILGLGPYYTTGSALTAGYSAFHSTWSFGISGGIGFSYGTGNVRPFFDTRYHLLFQGGKVWQFIPLTFGLAIG